MWQVMIGFAAGVYVGTYYECKPAIKMIKAMVEDKFPEEKNKK
jgi:ABC-type phosphate transport system permease subunit